LSTQLSKQCQLPADAQRRGFERQSPDKDDEKDAVMSEMMALPVRSVSSVVSTEPLLSVHAAAPAGTADGQSFSVMLTQQRQRVRAAAEAAQVDAAGLHAGHVPVPDWLAGDAALRKQVLAAADVQRLDLPAYMNIMMLSHEISLRVQLTAKIVSDLSQGVQQLTTRLQ
jgi:hypothetical protein